MRVHILVRYQHSPIYHTSPKVKAIYADLKEAKAEATRLNERSHSYEYWVESFKVKEKSND